MNCYVIRELQPIRKVAIELTVDEAVALQRTITSVMPDVVKDRVFDALTRLLREESIPGGVYV